MVTSPVCLNLGISLGSPPKFLPNDANLQVPAKQHSGTLKANNDRSPQCQPTSAEYSMRSAAPAGGTQLCKRLLHAPQYLLSALQEVCSNQHKSEAVTCTHAALLCKPFPSMVHTHSSGCICRPVERCNLNNDTTSVGLERSMVHERHCFNCKPLQMKPWRKVLR